MDDHAPGWLPDPGPGSGPVKDGRERYWNGTAWTDRVRPVARARSLRLPEHVPELQRALAAATADIDAVEDHLSDLFDRRAPPAPRTDEDVEAAVDVADVDPPAGDLVDDDGAFAELDAALAAEEPDELERVDGTARRGIFHRRT